MNTTVRTIVVSAATVAVLGLAGTATADDLTTAAHHQAVTALADTPAPVQQAAAVQPVAPATYTNAPQQVSSTAVGVGVGTTGVILLAALVFYAVKHHNQRWGWQLVSFALGVSMSASVFGGLSTSLVNSGVTAVSNVASGLTH